MNTKYILIAILSVLLFSCYSEDDIVAEKGENIYDFKDSNDPVDKFRYNFQQETGSVILFDFEERDYTWNIIHSYAGSYDLTKIKDENKLAGIEYAEKVFFSLYSNEYKKNFFPFKILMVESMSAYDWMTDSMADYFAKTGKGFISIGRLNDNVGSLTTEELYAARGGINEEYWVGFMFGNDKFKVPDSYYAVSEDYYDQEMTSGVKEDYGFVWVDDSWGTYFPGSYIDLKTFINYIFSHTNAEMQDLCNQYPKIKEKYDILVYAMKDQCGFDLSTLKDL